MALTISAPTTSSFTTQSPISFSHTTSAGSNKILVVIINSVSNTTVSSATYNSVSLTKFISNNDGNAQITTDIWYLINPTVGANTLSITMGGSVNCVANAYDVTGGDTSTPLGAQNYIRQAGNNATPTSATITTQLSNSIILANMLTVNSNGNSVTYGIANTNTYALANGNPEIYGGTTGFVSGAQTVTFTPGGTMGDRDIQVVEVRAGVIAPATKANANKFFIN